MGKSSLRWNLVGGRVRNGALVVFALLPCVALARDATQIQQRRAELEELAQSLVKARDVSLGYIQSRRSRVSAPARVRLEPVKASLARIKEFEKSLEDILKARREGLGKLLESCDKATEARKQPKPSEAEAAEKM